MEHVPRIAEPLGHERIPDSMTFGPRRAGPVHREISRFPSREALVMMGRLVALGFAGVLLVATSGCGSHDDGADTRAEVPSSET